MEKEEKMPLTGQYTFAETESALTITIPLKGVSPKKVDIFCAGDLLKVNFAPYLIDVLLLKQIDPRRHTGKKMRTSYPMTLFLFYL